MSSNQARKSIAAAPGALPAKHSWSLSRRLTAWYAGSAFVLVLAGTAILQWALIRGFRDEDDQYLAERIHVLRTLLKQQEHEEKVRWEVEVERADFELPHIYLRVIDPQNNSPIESAGMSQLLPPEAFPAPSGNAEPILRYPVESASGRKFLVAAAEAVGAAGTNTHIIHAALDLARREDSLETYRWMLVSVLGCAALISLGVGYQITQKGLQPLREIVGVTRRIGSSRLNEKISLDGLPLEVANLADNFNDMLTRLEDSFARMSHFSANAAHELRTPVNNLRGQAEVALSGPRSPEEYREVLAASVEECDNLTRIVDSLLLVAQAEWSKLPLDRIWVDVAAEIRSLVELYEASATEKGITLSFAVQSELRCLLDCTLFRRAISNLLSNALAHTPAGGSVSVSASQGDSETRIEVCDNGWAIPAEHLPHIFDRFYRVEEARSGNPRGLGLGLSIVKTIMELHGGAAQIDSQSGNGTRVRLLLPKITET